MSRASRARGAALIALLFSAFASVAQAQADPPPTQGYEEQRMTAVLEREGLTPALDPEGRRIAFVRIVRDDVFIEGELLDFLTFFNAFHWLTNESVIKRELLFAEGDAYRDVRIEETMRNLRSLGIFSFVRIEPVTTERPNEVGVVVHTRDLWSLRFENDFQLTGSNLDRLLLQLTERNLFGYQKTSTARFVMVPDVFRIGQLYVDRRVGNGHFYLAESFDLIFNRGRIPVTPDRGGHIEGFVASLQFRRPFYNLREPFSFSFEGSVSSRIARTLRNGQPLTYDDPATTDTEEIPLVWDETRASAAVVALFRRGERFKQTYGAGYRYEELVVDPNDETGLPDENAAAFARDVLPRERRQLGPTLHYALNLPTFATFEDLGTFGTSENVQTGPRLEALFWFPLSPLGSTTSSLVTRFDLGYVLAGGDALFDVNASVSARFEEGQVVDQRLRGEIRGASPRVGPFRLVYRLVYEGRRRDTQRTLVSLGGDNGLRGFVSQAFSALGANLIRGNLEIRTRPFVLASIHFGLVAFYDVGSVYRSTNEVALHHAAGLGLRVFFPQFNRYPFRGDVGVPLEGDGFSVLPSFGGLQAIPLTSSEDDLATQ